MERRLGVQTDYLLDGGRSKQRRTGTGSGGRLLGEGREGHYMYPRALGCHRATFPLLIPLFSFIYLPYRPGPQTPAPTFPHASPAIRRYAQPYRHRVAARYS